MIWEEFRNQVQDGIEGRNVGLLTTLPLINRFICGVQRGTYYLVGGETGSGKTAFVDQVFVIDPYTYAFANGKKIKIFYFSLEIEKIRKLAKWVAVKLFRDRGIITSMNEILSRGDSKIPEPVLRFIDEPGSREYYEKLYETVHIFDGGINPTGIFNEITSYCEKNGSWKQKEVILKGVKHETKIYVPNDKEEVVLFITDHLGLIKREHEKGGLRLFNKKENIDKLSEYCIILRNKYGVSPVAVSQFNRELSDIDRQRFKELQPTKNDFKDTGNPGEDCNVMIALFNPMNYNISAYMNNKYNTAKLGGRFRSVSILKNRDGEDNVRIGMNFLGETGIYREFPKVDVITEDIYSKAVNFKPW